MVRRFLRPSIGRRLERRGLGGAAVVPMLPSTIVLSLRCSASGAMEATDISSGPLGLCCAAWSLLEGIPSVFLLLPRLASSLFVTPTPRRDISYNRLSVVVHGDMLER
jgi:hypothetical protein